MPERVIPIDALPRNRNVHRVILHWTAGGPKPSALDKAHYHFLVDQQGMLYRGAAGPGIYLPHTRQLNTGSVGLSLCGMAGATSLRSLGAYPLTKVQIERACQAAADIIAAYDLALSGRTCLTHAEVTTVYGIEQRGKWDITVLPPWPEIQPEHCGTYLRDKVQWYLQRFHGRR